MRSVECGPRDVVWLGRAIRIFITSRLEDGSVVVVTTPNGMAPSGIDRRVVSAPADAHRTSHVFSLFPGETFEIGRARVRLEDIAAAEAGAAPFHDRLLHIDTPPGWAVTHDAGTRCSARAAARARLQAVPLASATDASLFQCGSPAPPSNRRPA